MELAQHDDTEIGDEIDECEGPQEFEVRVMVTYRITAEDEDQARALAQDNATGCDVDHISIESVQAIG